MLRYVINGLLVYWFLSLINSSNSKSSSWVFSISSLLPEIWLPQVGAIGLLSNSADGKVVFIDEKLDEISMLLSDGQFCAKYLVKLSLMTLVPY